MLLIFMIFVVIAGTAVAALTNQDPENRRINLVARQYAEAWRTGRLDSLQYDPRSSVDISKVDPSTGEPGKGEPRRVDPDKVADNVKRIVSGLTGDPNDHTELRPERIELDPAQTRRFGKSDELARTRLWVTWKLQPSGLEQRTHSWTYAIDLLARQSSGRWHVMWMPEAVHPAIRHGLVLQLTRTQPARSTVLGAGDIPLPPADQPGLARGLLGAIARPATHEQAASAPLVGKDNDTVGVAGLQQLYNTRLAGGDQITIEAVPQKGGAVANITPVQQPLFVGPPEAPKPLEITLDRRIQGAAEGALTGLTTRATLVVVKASTGELLASANTSSRNDSALDYGLSSQAAPGPVFGLASALALFRSSARSQNTLQKYTLTTTVNCSEPFAVGGQVFRNVQGPRLDGVQLGAAIGGGCTTGIARASADVSPETLRSAAYDLGLATPRDTTDGTPGFFTIADQLGTPAFHGSVPPTRDNPERDPVRRAENMVGEGQVLVSPLSMARAAATVSSQTRRAVRLIVAPAPTTQDQPKKLPDDEHAALVRLMAKGVSEPAGSAHALSAIGDVHALAGTSGYGTGQDQLRQAWCVGYLGDYAFAVLVPDTRATRADQAVTVASKFLQTVRPLTVR